MTLSIGSNGRSKKVIGNITNHLVVWILLGEVLAYIVRGRRENLWKGLPERLISGNVTSFERSPDVARVVVQFFPHTVDVIR